MVRCLHDCISIIKQQAQVRYMAVAEGNRNQHIGSRLLHELEKIAWTQDADELCVVCP